MASVMEWDNEISGTRRLRRLHCISSLAEAAFQTPVAQLSQLSFPTRDARSRIQSHKRFRRCSAFPIGPSAGCE
jgi:hypothetical protein